MIRKCLNLYKKNKEVINYLIVGGLTTVISIGSFALFALFKSVTSSYQDFSRLEISRLLDGIDSLSTVLTVWKGGK